MLVRFRSNPSVALVLLAMGAPSVVTRAAQPAHTLAVQSQAGGAAGQEGTAKSQDSAPPAKPATDKPSSDKPSSDKPSSDKPVSDKPTSDKTTSDKSGSEKQVKDADANLQRQKQLADDTAQLLTLANELKAEMDKSTKDTLSLSVVKKAEAVEKLAHKVRDEMKKSIGN